MSPTDKTDTESTPPENPAEQPTKDDASQTGDASSTDRTPEQIRADIEEAREEMGETVAALAEKADVKAQAKKKVDETKAQVREKVSEATGRAQESSPESASAAANQAAQAARENPVPAAAIGALLLGIFIGWLWGR